MLEPIRDRGGLGKVILIHAGGKLIRDCAGMPEGIGILAQILQGAENRILDLFQPGRFYAAGFAGVISFHLAGTGFATVVERHQPAAHAAVDEAGERIDGAAVHGAGALGNALGADGADLIPLGRSEERRHTAGDPDGLRRGDAVARIGAHAPDEHAGIDFIS